MSTEATVRARPPYNPKMLRWAREFGVKSIDEAAQCIRVSASRIAEFEEGDTAPTTRQGRMLAEFYGRHFLELFREAPPNIQLPKLVPDFRLYSGATAPLEDRDLIAVQGWAESLRLNAVDLYDEIGESVPRFPESLFVTTQHDPEKAAFQCREAMGFPISEQAPLSSSDRPKLPDIIRRHVEKLGVIVARSTGLLEHQARGLCIAEHPLPTIVYCSKEYPAPQAFTIAHELGHILLNESGIIGEYSKAEGKGEKHTIERWCNRFAGAFLIPESALKNLVSKPQSPLKSIDDESLRRVANYFGVSDHAALVRLTELHYVAPNYYWETKRAEFIAIESKPRGGRSKYFGSRYSSSVGALYTGLVLEAWNLGRITNHNAAEFMGIKNLQHLSDIRKNFVG